MVPHALREEICSPFELMKVDCEKLRQKSVAWLTQIPVPVEGEHELPDCRHLHTPRGVTDQDAAVGTDRLFLSRVRGGLFDFHFIEALIIVIPAKAGIHV